MDDWQPLRVLLTLVDRAYTVSAAKMCCLCSSVGMLTEIGEYSGDKYQVWRKQTGKEKEDKGRW